MLQSFFFCTQFAATFFLFLSRGINPPQTLPQRGGVSVRPIRPPFRMNEWIIVLLHAVRSAITATAELLVISTFDTNDCSVLWFCADCDYSAPLGMISGDIQDWQLSASSTYPHEWDKNCHERYARLYQANGRGWCARYKTSSEWLQVDLGVAAKVSDWFHFRF